MPSYRVVLPVLAAAALSAAGGPARADSFTVDLDVVAPFQGGDVTTAVCTATAQTTARGWVAVFTAVRCSIDDVSTTAELPGSRAAVPAAAPVGPTYLVCVSGGATFASLDGGRVFVLAPEECFVVDH